MSSQFNSEARNNPPSNFVLLYRLFRKHLLLALLPFALFSAIAATYVTVKRPPWKATQSLQVRDELAFQTVMPGRFDSLDMMKMVQETIHDTVRRQTVVEKVLKSMPPPADYEHPENWPNLFDVEGLQNSISLSPPNGAEFGRTEVLLLSVKSETAERAKQLVARLANELQVELNHLRDKRAESIENELKESVKLAQSELQAATLELADFESGLGPILVDLRSISSDIGSGGSGLQTQLNVVLGELRGANQRYEALSKQLQYLRQASEDPNNLISFSSEILTAQPALRKLKDELIVIQSSTARILGQFKPFHAKAKTAKEAENVVKRKILDEVRVAEKGLETQILIMENQIKRLQKVEEKLNLKFQRMAQIRAPYSELVKKVEQRRTVLNRALEELSRVSASRAAANTTHLITLIDEPFTGSQPEGMSKKVIIGTAGFAGLLSGIGLVFFAASPSFVGTMASRQSLLENDFSATVSSPAAAMSAAESPAAESPATGSSAAAMSATPSPASQSPADSANARARHNQRRKGHGVSDLEVHKVDLSLEETEELLAAEYLESSPTEPPKPRVEPFKLEPRKGKAQESKDDSQVIFDEADSTIHDARLDESGEVRRRTEPDQPDQAASDHNQTAGTTMTEATKRQQDESLNSPQSDPIDEPELKRTADETAQRLQEEHRRRIEKMFED